MIGPGPAVIGEGGELDAAAAEAIGALRERRVDVIFVTSNPATVASDPRLAHRTYLEPLDTAAVSAIALAERPTRVLPLFGGAKALELAHALTEDGTFDRAGVTLLGLSKAALAHAVTSAAQAPAKRAELQPGEAWCTFEVVSAFDDANAFVVLCTIESLDDSTLHPGDAVGVSPPLGLSDEDLQTLHSAARRATASAGLVSGLATCELARRKSDGEIRVIGVTPGVTRGTAFAARATGHPVTHVAVGLALGLRLSDLGVSVVPRVAHESVVRWPRFAFETFPDTFSARGSHRTSLGESLGKGATLSMALRSAARGVDHGSPVACASLTSATTAGTAKSASRRILVLGAGPTRIGQGPELAACASEAMIAARELGFEPVFLDGCLEATAIAARVATRVHLEPVTLERVLALYRAESAAGVILQFGGQQGLELAAQLAAHGMNVFGTTPSAMARATASIDRSSHESSALDEAIVIDVDAVADGARVVIAGLTEHLEPAYVHGGDAALMLPSFTLHPDLVVRIEDRVRSLALASGIVGLLGVRLAVVGDDLVILEVEPRAGRTTAFVSRATGFPLARVAAGVMLGKSLDAQGVVEPALPRHVAARERVFPFERLGVDPALGREMRSTGEVIGLDDTPARAYAKALRAMGISLRAPVDGALGARRVLLSVADRDRTAATDLARRFRAIGFDVLALGNVRGALTSARIPFDDGHDLESAIHEVSVGTVAFAVVTARGDAEIARTRSLRAATLKAHLPCFTTLRLAGLGCSALEEDPTPRVHALQDWYAADV